MVKVTEYNFAMAPFDEKYPNLQKSYWVKARYDEKLGQGHGV